MAPYGLNDVYFDHRYVSLYTSPSRTAEAFVYETDDALFFLPYLIDEIQTDIADLYDFETAYGYSGPLSTSRDPKFLDNAWKAFDTMCTERGVVAGFIRFHPHMENHRFAVPRNMTIIPDCETVYIDLNQDEDAVWQGYASDNRNRIRKSMKMGVVVEIHREAAALTTFSRFYLKRMEELSADESYRFGQDYFRGIGDLGSDRFRVYLAKHGNEIIGGALILLSGRYAHFHLSASPVEFREFSANNRLRHDVIVDLLGQGLEILNFGGGRTGDPKDPLLNFKSRFSRARAQRYIGKYVVGQADYDAVCAAWRGAHPDKVDAYGNHLMCYRYV